MNLSIKNVPAGIVQQLRRRAKERHRSLQGELLTLLEETVVRPRPLTVDEAYRRIKALNLHTPSDSVEIIRRARDGR